MATAIEGFRALMDVEAASTRLHDKLQHLRWRVCVSDTDAFTQLRAILRDLTRNLDILEGIVTERVP